MLPLHLQPESHIPLYVQLRDQLRALVHSGELRSGDRIPASRELAVQLGVHRTTVANAYAELESEGLIQGHVGRGTFICGVPVKQFTPAPRTNGNGNGGMRWESLFADERGGEGLSRLMPQVPADAIAFVNARPSEEFFPVEDFRRCCNSVLRNEGRRVLQLGSTDGYEPLKRVLIGMLLEEGLTVSPEQLLITDGCQQGLDLLCKAFLRPGDSVVIENPAYPGAIAIFAGAHVRALGATVQTDSRRGPVGVDVDALESVLMQNRVKFILVTPDFHNPTGTTLPVAERRKLLEVAARYHVPIVEDAIYSRLRLRGNAVPSLKSLDRSGGVIQIDSFSKIAFPGLRVGWCIGPERAIERLRLVKQSTDLHTDQLAQATLAEFVRRGYLARHLAKMKKVYRSRLEVLEEALRKDMPDETTWTRPEGGMTIWVTLPPGFDAGELLIHIRERGIWFVPGRYFFVQNPEPNTLRLGFAGLDETQIARGVQKLGELLAIEFRKRERGARHEMSSRVALI
jgi:2-aminoadipate transaminase